MSESLLAELERFARKLIDAQETLLQIMRRKRTALTTSDLAALEAIQVPEQEAAQQLQTLVSWRGTLLKSAQRGIGRFETLTDLAKSLSPAQSPPVIALFDQAQRLAIELRQESWVQWIITNRCCNFYSEVLELIAQGGKKAPTYDPAEWAQRGGALMDASA